MYKKFKKFVGPKQPVNIEQVLKALANGRRLFILNLLKDKKRLSVGEISKKIKLSLKSTSKHLVILSAAGLLEKEQKSVQVYYSVSSELNFSVRTILNIILQDYM